MTDHPSSCKYTKQEKAGNSCEKTLFLMKLYIACLKTDFLGKVLFPSGECNSGGNIIYKSL